jgi:phage recombination protein Bet
MSTNAIATTQTIPPMVLERGLDAAQWNTICNSLYPGAKAESVLLVLDYCKARKLDPMKKPCHIVPMKLKQGDDYVWRDVVLPGIYEYRTTAMRTGLYLGHTAPAYGEVKEYAGVWAPEWCSMTFKRLGPNDLVIEFPVTVYFREVCNTKDEWIDKKRTGRVIANDRWAKAPFQMLNKTCEAAGLREAFPDEFGGEQTAEEMAGQERPEEELPVVRAAARLSAAQAGTVATTPVSATLATNATDATKEAGTQATTSAQAEPVRQAPSPIGIVVKVEPRGDGGPVVVSLDSGFKAKTRRDDFIQAAVRNRDASVRVEIVATPSKKGPGYLPDIESIEPAPVVDSK